MGRTLTPIADPITKNTKIAKDAKDLKGMKDMKDTTRMCDLHRDPRRANELFVTVAAFVTFAAFVAFVLHVALVMPSLLAQGRPAAVQSPRIYVFENGYIKGLSVKLFNFAPEEIKQPNLVNISYLVVHPKGTLQFDAGAVADSHFKPGGGPVVEGIMSADKPLLPQLAAAGYQPSDVTYFAMSHYHSDHTANANAFAGATWIVQKAERDWMFAEKPQGIIQPGSYSALRNAKTRVLDNADLDVFGDGTVRVISTPGHTPGHQVVLVRLPKRGPVILAGDLYHYPEEVTTGRIPTFEFSAEQSRASREKILALMKQTSAELWIEHDIATHDRLPKSPAYVE